VNIFKNPNSEKIAELKAGTEVEVLEISTGSEDARMSFSRSMTKSASMLAKRVRGRLNEPPGWITLLNTETGKRRAKKQAIDDHHDEGGGHKGHGHEGGGHGHGHDDDHHHLKKPSIFSALASGVINFVLMFGFCCAYGMIIFSEAGHKKHVGLGIKMCLASAAVLGLTLSFHSKLPVAMGGPDMNAVIFIGGFVEKISKDLSEQLHLTKSHSGMGPEDYYFCKDDHLASNQAACNDYHDQLRATTIFAASVSSGVLGIIFLTLGGLKITRYISYMPSSIVDAFLSCMGYKVFKYGLKLCKNEPKNFIPAACVGVPLYFVKRMHMMNPVLAQSNFLGGPVVVYYFILL
jgi:hypothetical protein